MSLSSGAFICFDVHICSVIFWRALPCLTTIILTWQLVISHLTFTGKPPHWSLLLSCCSHCSTCPCSGGWFSTTICPSECWRSVRATLWVHDCSKHISLHISPSSTETWTSLLCAGVKSLESDSELLFTGQEEHSFHAGAALSVCPHGGLHSQVCGSLCCGGVAARGLQDQWGPTGTTF